MPLNISLDQPDATLEETQKKIDLLSQVGGAFRTTNAATKKVVDGVLETVQAEPNTSYPCQLDLIAHAREGVLHFGEWVIAPKEGAGSRIVSALGPHAINQIRILGCLTAELDGIAALKHLCSVFKCRIFGTTTLIGAKHFDSSGFVHPELLDEIMPTSTKTSNANVSALFAQLDSVASTSINNLQHETQAESSADRLSHVEMDRWSVRIATPHTSPTQILGSGVHDVRELPGLLQLPDRETLFPAPPVSGTPRFIRVTSFFAGQLLRLYPVGKPAGVLVRPERPFK
jgi:hypothetical protein